MKLVLNGKIVGYDLEGISTKTILMLHGWGADRKSLEVLHSRLTKKYRILRVDVPGFGESERPATAWSLSDYANWVNDVLAKLKVKNLFGIIGHSNGGAIAIKLVSSGLEVKKLVLIGASGIRRHRRGKKLIYKVVSKTGKTASLVLPKKVRHKLRSKWYKKIGSELYDVPGMEATFKKVASEDLVIDSAMISTPTLLIYGAEDQATPPVFGKIYHESIGGSELDIVEGAGHYVFVDKPLVVSERVEEFLIG